MIALLTVSYIVFVEGESVVVELADTNEVYVMGCRVLVVRTVVVADTA